MSASSLIILEGNISVGKSTLGRSLQDYLERKNKVVKYFPETIDETFLTLYLTDMKKYGFSFQIIMLFRRISLLKEIIHSLREHGGIVIMDRGITGDLAFAKLQYRLGHINEKELSIYMNYYNEAKDLLKDVRHIYLAATPEKLRERVIKRGNCNEIKAYNYDYFILLEECYQSSLSPEVIRLDWNEDLRMEGQLLHPDECQRICRTLHIPDA